MLRTEPCQSSLSIHITQNWVRLERFGDGEPWLGPRLWPGRRFLLPRRSVLSSTNALDVLLRVALVDSLHTKVPAHGECHCLGSK